MVSVVLEIFSNGFRRFALVGIHQPEAGPVRILLADLLDDWSVTARNRTIATQEYQHNHFAGTGSKRIDGATFKINCALLSRRETGACQQSSRNDPARSEFYP